MCWCKGFPSPLHQIHLPFFAPVRMNFLLCSLDSPGMLYPLIGLARSLQARGHKVAFATNLDCGELLSEVGLERLPRGDKDGRSFQVASWYRWPSIALQVRHTEHALQHFPADVLVGQALTYGPMIVAEQREMPIALLGFSTYLLPTTDSPATSELESESDERRRWRYHSMVETFNQARRAFRLVPYEGSCRETPLLGDLFFVRNVPKLEPQFENLPEHVHLVGSCLWEPGFYEPELTDWLVDCAASGRPLVYVQHGRFFNLPSLWPALVEALDGLGCRVVASVNKMDSELGIVPDSFFVRPHIPQGAVLKSADLAISCGNSTAFLGAMTAGVPSLLIPGGGEQPDVAALGERVGVARTLCPTEATAERIRKEIQVLLTNSRYREMAAEYQTAFSQIDSFAKVVGLLEILAETRRPVHRESIQAPRMNF